MAHGNARSSRGHDGHGGRGGNADCARSARLVRKRHRGGKQPRITSITGHVTAVAIAHRPETHQ